MKKIFTLLLGFLFGSIAAQCPDLTIAQASILSLQDNGIRYALNISNLGNAEAILSGNSSNDNDHILIHSYLSKDKVISQDDKKIQDIVLGVYPLEKIAPGEVFSIVNKDSVVVTGYQYLIIFIDPKNDLSECNESNNIFVLELRKSIINLEIPDLEVISGRSIEIPVYANGLFNVLGFQFSISPNNSSLIKIDSIGNLGLPDWNKSDIRILNNNTIGAIWFSSAQQGVSINGKQRLFSIFAKLQSNQNECVTLDFTDAFLPIEFISNHVLDEPVPVTTKAGKICILNQVECGGTITLSNGRPVPQVLVKANAKSAFTDFNGRYSINNLTPGDDYTVSASKSEAYMNGLSVIDMLLIKKHLLQIQPFSTPYEIIAADVNGDLTISVQDIVVIRNLILGFIPDFGKTPVWQFIPKDYKFKNPNNPLREDYPISYFLPKLKTNKVALDFIAIKTGDVSLDWTSQSPLKVFENRSADFLTLQYPSQVLQPYHEYKIPVLASYSQTIDGIQFEINIDPRIQVVQISSPSLKGFGTQNTFSTQSKLSVVWIENSDAHDQSYSQNDTIFYITVIPNLQIQTDEIFSLSQERIPALVSTKNGERQDLRLESKNQKLGNFDNKRLDLKIYPNPTTDALQMHITGSFSDPIDIRIVDLKGRLVFNQVIIETDNQELRINTSRWPSGTYIVNASSNRSSISQKILCIH